MTANELWTLTLLEYEKLNSNGAPGILDSGTVNEASIILSKAQRKYVQIVLNQKNNRNREGFEETELRKQGISELIRDSITNISSNQTGNIDINSTFWDLPTDFMYTIHERAEIDKFDCSLLPIERRAIIPIETKSHNEYNKQISNPYRKPYFNGTEGIVWRMQYSREINNDNPGATVIQSPKRHELITDGTFNIVNYKLRYLRFPDDIIVDMANPNNQVHCKLDDRVHDVIVKIAVDELSEYLREQRPRQIVADYDIE